LPAWDLLPNFPDAYPLSVLETRRLPAAAIMTSRGCPFSCTFCDSLVFGRSVRTHSPEYTLNMIRFLRRRYGIRDLMMLDDNFILRRQRLFDICDTMIRERMGLQWYCMGHARHMTEERLCKIRQAGCWIIEMGIESGCDRILETIRKSTTKAEVAAAVERARAVGLKVKGNFIFGLPTETHASLEETTRFAASIGLSYFQQNFLTVWPGCEISRDPEHYGAVETDWQKLAHQRVTFVPTGLTEEDLIKASKRAFRCFYLRPRIILELLTLLRSWRGARTLATGFIGFLKTMLRPRSARLEL
jgi:anaerobic magnesium-protoporphyrin IX monomethyl ester cyclase